MSILRTLLASLVVVVLGGVALAAATDRFQAFTTETARRVAVREHPVAVPAVMLEAQTGVRFNLADLRGQWLLVDFIYTRCTTYCAALGSEFAQLQDTLAGPLAQGKLRFVSISFDPAHDTPQALAAYLEHSRRRGPGWIAARPVSASGLRRLEQRFGVTVIPDGLGGYTHNPAIHIVDPHGRLVAILDQGNPGRVALAVRRNLQ